MKTYLDCVLCIVRGALVDARLSTPDKKMQEQVFRYVLQATSQMDFNDPPPVMVQSVHRTIRKLTGCDDPYKKVKDHFNRFALKIYPTLKEKIDRSSLPFETAIRLSIAGNIIDFGANSEIKESLVHETIECALTQPISGDLEGFREAVNTARNILFLGDNAGEIVFDRLFIEQIPIQDITYVVRGGPIMNDATMTDAIVVGMTDLVDVIDNGSDAPGTILDDCSGTFLKRFDQADLIIAKGQGNYETLSNVDKNIFFLMKAKCNVIASEIGCEIGDLVIFKNKIHG